MRHETMSHKRKRKESNVLLDCNDDCIMFNGMKDLDTENDSNENDDDYDVTMPPLVSIFDQKPPSDGTKIGVGSNANKTRSDFTIDENIITKYFMSAIQSYDNPTLVTEMNQGGIGGPGGDQENDNDATTRDKSSYTLIETWKPMEIELPFWAVIASQK